ncbi:MAG: hypothetical protein VB934_16495, partial [Polyangiaceae bacterium]
TLFRSGVWSPWKARATEPAAAYSSWDEEPTEPQRQPGDGKTLAGASQRPLSKHCKPGAQSCVEEHCSGQIFCALHA